jgi:hypothetical protein
MYLLVEHNGTAAHHTIFDIIEDYFEDNIEGIIEETIQEGESLSLYNESLDKIVSFIKVPTSEELRLLFKLIDEPSS